MVRLLRDVVPLHETIYLNCESVGCAGSFGFDNRELLRRAWVEVTDLVAWLQFRVRSAFDFLVRRKLYWWRSWRSDHAHMGWLALQILRSKANLNHNSIIFRAVSITLSSSLPFSVRQYTWCGFVDSLMSSCFSSSWKYLLSRKKFRFALYIIVVFLAPDPVRSLSEVTFRIA